MSEQPITTLSVLIGGGLILLFALFGRRFWWMLKTAALVAIIAGFIFGKGEWLTYAVVGALVFLLGAILTNRGFHL